MLAEIFLKGLVIGFSIAAPVGPIGVLCIRRTLADGWVTGLVSGLGAASADATYGLVAALGLTVVSSFLVDRQIVLQVLGGTFLVYLGLKTLRTRPSEQAADLRTTDNRGLPGAFFSAFALTVTNPLTILSFAAILAGLGLAGAAGGYLSGTVLVGGVFLGSAGWWVILSSAFGLFRRRMKPAGMHWINRLSGGLILAFGIAALFGGIAPLFR